MRRRFLLVLCCLEVMAMGSAQAQSTEWSFGNWGLYGSALSDYYTSPDCPFDFFIVQCVEHAVAQSPEVTPAQLEWIEHLDKQVAAIDKAGRRAICYIWFWKSYDEKDGKAPCPSVEEAFARLDVLLSRLDQKHVYAITLGEENVWWGGRAELLAGLYHAVKKKYPQLRVYQWYTNGPEEPPGFGGPPLLPADGWILDEYNASGEQLERFLAAFRMMDIPVIQLCWATTTWGGITWDPKRLHAQIEACRKYNVPVAFFSVNQGLKNKKGEVMGDFWAWDMTEEVNEPTTRRIFKDLEKQARRRSRVGKRVDPDDRSLQQSHAVGPFWVATNRQDQFVYEEDFLEAGRWSKDADIEGRLDLKWRPGRLAIRGVQGRTAQAKLIYHFVGDGAMTDVQAQAEVVNQAPLGGVVEVALSRDGRKWPIRQSASEGDGPSNITLRLDRPAKEVWVRLTLKNVSGKSTETCSSISAFRFSCKPAPVTERLITLKPDARGSIQFTEDFRNLRLRETAVVSGNDLLHWDRGVVSLSGRKEHPAQAAIEQRFACGRPMRALGIQAQVWANVRDLGGNVELSASPDGKEWLPPVTTERMLAGDARAFNGVLSLDLSQDQRFTDIKEFVVRVILRDVSGNEKSVGCKISRLMVTGEVAGKKTP